MTEPELSPEQDAVRRLLAESRHQAPVPAEIQARLDATLTELVQERRPVVGPPVIDLAARRRRRRASALLAAAALVVGGVSVGQMLDGSGVFSGSDNAMTADSAESGASDSGPSAVKERAQSQAKSDPSADAPAPYGSGETLTREIAPPAIRSTHLRQDLRRARSSALAAVGELGTDYSGVDCATQTALGNRVAVTLDGAPAVAVFGVPIKGFQTVTVHRCTGTAEPVSVRLRLP